MAALFFSTKLRRPSPPFRLSCCALCKRVRFDVSAQIILSVLMCALSLPLTETLNRKCVGEAFARTCFTG